MRENVFFETARGEAPRPALLEAGWPISGPTREGDQDGQDECQHGPEWHCARSLWAPWPPRSRTAPAVDPVAVQQLKQMTEFLDGLQQFSVQSESTLEELHVTGTGVEPRRPR